jgi:hypothetical protein
MCELDIPTTMSNHTHNGYGEPDECISILELACKTRRRHFCMVHLIINDCKTLFRFGDKHVPGTVINITVSLLLGKVRLISPVKYSVVYRAYYMGIVKQPFVVAYASTSKYITP